MILKCKNLACEKIFKLNDCEKEYHMTKKRTYQTNGKEINSFPIPDKVKDINWIVKCPHCSSKAFAKELYYLYRAYVIRIKQIQNNRSLLEKQNVISELDIQNYYAIKKSIMQ
jgi:hypothetical protein